MANVLNNVKSGWSNVIKQLCLEKRLYIVEKKASDIQKERIKELEDKANLLLGKCDVLTLASINEKDIQEFVHFPN